MPSPFARAWQRYRTRKSRFGIWTDFLFLLLVVVMLVPPLRDAVQVGLVRAGLMQPHRIDQTIYIGRDKPIRVHDAFGRDTLIFNTFPRPTLYNFGGTWSPQSRAELRSLNRFAERYRGRIDVIFLTDEDTATVRKYWRRRKYNIPVYYYQPIDQEQNTHDIYDELRMNVPASLLIDRGGKVVVRKFGAAKWTGRRIEALADTLICYQNTKK